MRAARWLACWLAFAMFTVLGLPQIAHAQSIESVLAPGEVIQGHVKYEKDCNSCHVRFNPKGQDQLCMDCHKEVGADFKNKQGFHGKQKNTATCRSCHTDHKGRKAKIIEFDPKKFDHKQTDYVVKGKHKDVECEKCHKTGKKYREAPSECISCHKADDVHKGGIMDKSGAISKCSDCHTDNSWKETDYDHGKKTRFALEDKHGKLKCDECHAKARYKDTPRTCIGCHKKDDTHKGQYGEKCETCHNAKVWKDVSRFNHDTDTKYALRGKHRKTTCNDCHTGNLYKQKLQNDCYSCHKKDDKHKDTLGRDCETCHSESGWKDSPRFDHDKSSFPLLGKHIKVECKECHKSALYKEAPKDCYSCHKKDDKHEGTLGTKCETCHAERDWKTTAGRFDHDKTKFALRNGHATPKIKCADCHTKGLKDYRNTKTDCYSCHKKDDKHDGSQGKECEQCHSDKEWKVTLFDHGKTKFPLTGRHNGIECSKCHETKRFKDVKRECIACHVKDDKHKATLGTACETCHNARSWKSWDFNHDKKTKYPLTGAHIRTKCESCHSRAAPTGKPIAEVGQRCVDCHSKDDAHDGQFGRRCETCHVTAKWLQVDRAFRSQSGPVDILKSNGQFAHLVGYSSRLNQPI